MKLNYSSLFNIFVDCCDGSDEYDGNIFCPNTCVMGGNIAYKSNNYISTTRDVMNIVNRKAKEEITKEEGLFEKLIGKNFIQKPLNRFHSTSLIVVTNNFRFEASNNPTGYSP